MFLKTNSFKSRNRNRLSKFELGCNTSGSQLRLLLVRLSHKTTKQKQIHAEAKTSQIILRHHIVHGNVILD